MKISPILPQTALSAYGVSRKPGASKPFAVSENVDVDFSQDAKLFLSAVKAVSASFTESAGQDARIRAITEQIKAGTYNPSASDVAEKMMTTVFGK